MIKFLILILAFVNSSEAGCFLNHSSMDCRLRYRNLYDFGQEAGDTNFTKMDDHFILVQTPSVFKFYGKSFSSFYLSSNGVIELINKNISFELHNKFQYEPTSFPLLGHSLIAPFWSDHLQSTDEEGEVFYRMVSDSETLSQIAYDIKLYDPSNLRMNNFMPTWSCIATWYQLKAHNHRRFPYNNTFQLVLASNGEASYIMFNYGGMDWPNMNVNVSVTVGYNLGDSDSFFQIKDSALNITDLQHRSNVGLRSRWMYRVDRHKSEIIHEILNMRITDSSMLYVILILIILIGINSLVNTALWIIKCRIETPTLPSLFYNKQLNESQMVLSQIA